jgi:hypothetical protein
MCQCGGPKWKREVVPDHKFDFVNTQEFTDNGFMMRMRYLWLYIIVLKSFLVYISDIFSAITMLTTKNWSNEIFKQCQTVQGCFFIPFNTGKWLFVGCIIVSFLLLAYESRKSKKIIASRDISYAFTNILANNYYSLRSYDHFCFFEHISNSTKTSDEFAFFVFFIFKSWKRLLLADSPRQAINALTLYAVWLVKHDKPGSWYYIPKYFKGNSMSTSALTVTSFFSVVMCAGSLFLLIIAGICYVPLLLHIRGNLKEYCCHKVDKRIDVIIKRKQQERRLEANRVAQKEALGDYSHLKNKKGELIAQPLPQPTLPNLSVDDVVDDKSSMNTRVAPSYHTSYSKEFYYQSDKDYPPMPAYNPYSAQIPGNYASFNPSSATFSYDDPTYPQPHMYDNDNESTQNLAAAAAPFARDPVDRQPSPYGLPPSNSYNPHDVYHGRAGSTPPQQQPQRRRSPPNSVGLVPNGAAYDEPSQYRHQFTQSPVSRLPSEDPNGGFVTPGAETYSGGLNSGRRNYDEEAGYGRSYGGQSQRL